MKQWIIEGNVNPDARVRLFCVPYAGGGASIFHRWRNGNLREAEICAVQMPGRESRISEDPLTSICRVVEELGKVITSFRDLPFALFGHSNGALVCFELARMLRRKYQMFPVSLIVSGQNAPDCPPLRPPIAQLPEKEFLQSIKRLNGVPQDIEFNKEVLELLLPTLRADIHMSESYRYVPEEPLDCPILAIYGTEDPETSYDSMLAWQRQTQRDLRAESIVGDHFFLNSRRRELLKVLSCYLKNLPVDPRPRIAPTCSTLPTSSFKQNSGTEFLS
jgi:medium-chain acyl-[acyl-carrier-protein] hydrolase